MASERLEASDRAFLSALAGVVFGNPYTAQRAELIQRLAPGAVPTNREALAKVVVARLGDVLRQAPAVVQRLPREDRALVETALLYVTYHRHVPQIDAHIERQAKTTGEPLGVDFGKEPIAELMRSGFDEERAVRYFGRSEEGRVG